MNTTPLGTLDEFRAAIDKIDDQLLALLCRRAEIAKALGKQKAANHVGSAELRVTARENTIIERLEHANTGPFPTASIKPVFIEIFRACLGIQQSPNN